MTLKVILDSKAHCRFLFDNTKYMANKTDKRFNSVLSMTPVEVYDPFCIIDFLSRCLSWFWDKICEYFLSLIDCLITPKCEVPEMGDFDVGIFHLLTSVNNFWRNGRRIGTDTSSCNTSENQGRWGQRGAIRTILHQDWCSLARTDGIRQG